ncbi:MAG: sigma-54-dependent Fis family transcriptional regulator [Desulfobacter sp.]|nr:sigma-54-dependent Fis family transcriptional regulator [Desulfobacter sp.]
MMTHATPMLNPGKPVLVIDDEPESLDGCEFILNSAGITHVNTLNDARRAFEWIDKTPPEIVVLDLSMPHVSGREILAHLTRTRPHIPVIILTGMNQVDTAVDCMKAGAFDYLVKPVEESRMIASVKKAIEITQERREYREFRDKILGDRLSDPNAFSGYITASKKLRTLFQYAETIAPTLKPVLITGESGVGQEIIARAIHQLSMRPGKMVSVNVAGLDETLFSDTLFGHLRGAFTNAGNLRHGMVKKA